jgi:two-component system response regulator YesN
MIKIKLLIVDDEHLVIKGITTIVEREKLDIEVLSANNGLEALKIIEKNHIDIIVTDVKMPIMDGLEFCENLKKQEIQSKIIIISGYQDFEYARKAIEYGVKRYVLKPINHEKFIQLLKNTIDELKDECRNEVSKIKKLEVAKKKILSDLALGICTYTCLVKQIESTGVDFANGKYMIILIYITKDNEKNIDDFTTLFEDMLENYPFNGIITEYKQGEYAILLEFRGQRVATSISQVKVIFEKCSKRFNVGCSIGASSVHETLQEIFRAFAEAQQAVGRSFMEGKNNMVVYGDKARDCVDNSLFLGNNMVNTSLLNEIEEKLLQSLKELDHQKSQKHVDQYFKVLCEYNAEYNYIHMAILGLFVNISKFIISLDTSISKVLDGKQITYETLNNFRNINALKCFLKNVVEAIINHIENMQRNQRSDEYLVSQAKKIIENDIKNCTLEYVASKIGISPAYLSTIFKAKTNINFKEYLVNTKIKYAQALLINSNYSVLKISQEIGYANSRYFCKVFKKITGCSPSAYRINKGLKII